MKVGYRMQTACKGKQKIFLSFYVEVIPDAMKRYKMERTDTHKQIHNDAFKRDFIHELSGRVYES